MLSGGKILQSLRRKCGASIEAVAGEAGITYITLSKIERGLTESPSREILGKILMALEQMCGPINILGKQAVFEAYGYKIPCELPVEGEVAAVRQIWQKMYGQIIYPAYLIDVSQKLLDWNRYAPHLLGLRSTDKRTQYFRGITIFDLVFQMSSGFVVIAERDAYVRQLLQVIKAEFKFYNEESWCTDRINETKGKYPEFAKIWDSIDENVRVPPAGNTIMLHSSGSAPLFFQLVGVEYIDDHRFRTVQWIPLDKTTTAACQLWAEEEDGEK